MGPLLFGTCKGAGCFTGVQWMLQPSIQADVPVLAPSGTPRVPVLRNLRLVLRGAGDFVSSLK